MVLELLRRRMFFALFRAPGRSLLRFRVEVAVVPGVRLRMLLIWSGEATCCVVVAAANWTDFWIEVSEKRILDGEHLGIARMVFLARFRGWCVFEGSLGRRCDLRDLVLVRWAIL